MELKPIRVLAECTDARSGQRFAIGDIFTPVPSVAQAKRLVAAGCLPETAIAAAEAVEESGRVDFAAISRAQLNHDGLFDKSMDELRQIVAEEGIEPSEDELKGHVVDVIRRQRASRAASVPAENVAMRTEAGERAARQADALAAGTGDPAGLVENAHGIGPGTDGGSNPNDVVQGTVAGGGNGGAIVGSDSLDSFTVERLRDVAETEKLDLGTVTRKADIVAAIRAHRAKA